MVRIEVELTQSHLGYFEFKLCPKKSASELVTQACFDGHLLKLSDGSTRYAIKSYGTGYFYPMVQLPADVYCDNCVIQWTYKAGMK